MPNAVYAPTLLAAAKPTRAGHGPFAPTTKSLHPPLAGLGLPRFLQPKISVSQPEGAAEQEADRVADRLAGPGNAISIETDSGLSRVRTPASVALSRLSQDLGPGSPLDANVRERAASGLGHELGDVRIHTGAAADRAAASVGARAFTVGRDVVFAAGEHQPSTQRGRRLLMHELTHVARPLGAGSSPIVQRKEGAGNPPDPHPTLASRDDATDVITIGAAVFAVITSTNGPLRRVGGISGRYTKLDTPVGSSHGSVSWNYTISQAYENPQTELQVTPGTGREHVETRVLPAVNINVQATGGATPPTPVVRSDPKADRYKDARARFGPKMDELIVREEKKQTRTGEPPSAEDYFAAFDPSFTQFQNSVFLAHWTSQAEMLTYLDEAIARLRTKGDNRYADRVEELRAALVDEYQAARKRLANAPPRGAAGGFRGIQLVEVLGGLPAGGSSVLAFDRKAGPYTLHAIMSADVGNAVAYYSAHNRDTQQTDYVVGFAEADAFIANVDYHAAYAAAFRVQHPNGLRDYERESYLAQEQLGRGNVRDAFWTLLGAHGEGLTDPHLMGETALALLGGIAVEGEAVESVAARGARNPGGKPLVPKKANVEIPSTPVKPQTPAGVVDEMRPQLPSGVKAPPSHPQAKSAEQMIGRLEAEGEPVVANIGGAGRPHEPQNAININNQAVPRKGIPNHLNADGSEIGDILPPGRIDRIEGHRMAPGVVDWSQAAPGSFRALKPGGTFRYSYQGASEDAVKLAAELEKAGFKNVRNFSNALVTATKP